MSLFLNICYVIPQHQGEDGRSLARERPSASSSNAADFFCELLGQDISSSLKNPCRLLKKTQRRGARRSISGGVLFLYVDAKSVERNEAYESFSAVCLEGDDRSDAVALMHEIERLVNSLQGKPVRDHRINLDLAA